GGQGRAAEVAGAVRRGRRAAVPGRGRPPGLPLEADDLRPRDRAPRQRRRRAGLRQPLRDLGADRLGQAARIRGLRGHPEIEGARRLPGVDREAAAVIYMLRHGDAEEGDGDDAARRLTEKGERQATLAGQAMAALGLEFDACITSPKVRALDTARLACEAL